MTSRETSISLSFQAALLGLVTTGLRTVKIDSNEQSISFVAYIDGAISELDRDCMAEVELRIARAFPDKEVYHVLIRQDYPERISTARGQPVFESHYRYPDGNLAPWEQTP